MQPEKTTKGPTIHHYVPRFLLRRFTDPKTGLLWVYEKGKAGCHQRTPKNVAAERRYYAFKNEDGAVENTVEESLAKLEGDVAPLLDKLEQVRCLPSDLERTALAEFVSTSFLRVPDFRNNIEQFYGRVGQMTMQMIAAQKAFFDQTVRRYEQERGEPVNLTEETRQAILAGKFKYRGTPSASLDAFLRGNPRVARFIHQMRWQFLHAPEGVSFITSDTPVILTNPQLPAGGFFSSPGFGQKGVHVIQPLGRRFCLLARWEGVDGHYHLNGKMVIQINRVMIQDATRYVFAPNRSQRVENLVEKFSPRKADDEDDDFDTAGDDRRKGPPNGSR